MEPENKKVNVKRLFITIGIVLVTALAFGGSTYYVLSTNAAKEKEATDRQIAEMQTQIEELKSQVAEGESEATNGREEASNETANWKTYRNTEIGVSFSHPAGWTVTSEEVTGATGEITFDMGNSETFVLSVLPGPAGRGTPGLARFIRYDEARISGNKITLGTKVESSSSYLEGVGPTSGFLITTMTTNSHNNKYFAIDISGKDASNADNANTLFQRIVKTITLQ